MGFRTSEIGYLKLGNAICLIVGKYAYFAKDFALNSLMKSRYRFAKAPSILRRFEQAKKREDIVHQQETNNNSWFSIN